MKKIAGMANKRQSEDRPPHWLPIRFAPQNGSSIWAYTAASHGLPAFQGVCSYHPEAGWCTDELREVTHFVPLADVWLPPPTGG